MTEICAASGLGKSAVQRFCHTLVELGYLVKDPVSRRYAPSPQLLDFSFTYLSSDPLVQVATPYLIEAREQCGEAMNMSRRMGPDVIYISRLPSTLSRMTIPLVGGRAPAFCTASGRAIMSMLPCEKVETILDQSDLQPLTPMTIIDRDKIVALIDEGREQGYTIASQECIIDEITVAAPIIGREREVHGAINIATSLQEYSEATVRSKLAPIVRRTALEISRTMGLSPYS